MPESRHTRYNRSPKGLARSQRYRDAQVEKGLCEKGDGRPLAHSDGRLCNEHCDSRITPEQLMEARRRDALKRMAARHQTEGVNP